jgi:hypothetical protein
MLTNITNTIIAITADSKNRHEDAGRGELCVESWKRKIHFNTLGESGRVVGGRVETLYLFLTFTTMLSPSQSLKALTRMPDEVSLRSHVDEK